MSKKGKERFSGSGLWVTTFDEESALRFHAEAWQCFTEDPFNPLVINIDSPGGSAYALISMWETMDNIRAVAPQEFDFITYVHGTALSCGILLAAHGDVRVATPKSELMFHEVADSFKGREHQLDIQHENLKKFTEKVYNIFVHDTGFKGGIEAVKLWGEKDRWLTPSEAKELGIIDVVGYIKPRQIAISPLSIGECDVLSLRSGKDIPEEKKPVKKPTKRTTRKRK